MNARLALSALTAALLSVSAFAQTSTTSGTNTPRIDQRQTNQEQRIDQGVKSGSLTAKEAERLEKGQTHVDRMEERAKADGNVTRQERARLRQAERVQNRHIEDQKHDRQHDYDHDGRNDRRERRQERRHDHNPGSHH